MLLNGPAKIGVWLVVTVCRNYLLSGSVTGEREGMGITKLSGFELRVSSFVGYIMGVHHKWIHGCNIRN